MLAKPINLKEEIDIGKGVRVTVYLPCFVDSRKYGSFLLSTHGFSCLLDPILHYALPIITEVLSEELIRYAKSSDESA